jgi:Rrf2 family iron-sulfur cluster assembly transcriptional regulator
MFSKTTEYALRAVIYIAKYSSFENKIGIETISKAIDSPPSFIAKILQKLTKNEVLISSVTGPKGGFYFTDEAKKTSLMEVLTILNEDSVITKCVLGLQECSDHNPCPMHSQYKLIKPKIIEMFQNKTIEDLVKEMSDKKLVFRIPIPDLKSEIK